MERKPVTKLFCTIPCDRCLKKCSRFLSQPIIDVYREEGYRFSFRIPRQNREKARDFYVTDQHIIVLYPTQVVVYGYDPLVMAMNEQEKPNT